MDGSSAEPTAREAEAEAPEAAPPPPMPLVDRVKLVRDVFYIVALFIAGVWAVMTFAFHSWYQPKHEMPVVAGKLMLTITGVSGDQVAIHGHLALKNEGNVTQSTWAVSFNAYGYKVTSGPGPDGGWRHEAEGADFYDGTKDFSLDDRALLASQVDLMTQPGRTNPILPHSELSFDFDFFADRSKADMVKVNFDVIHPLRDELPKPEWFELKRTPDGTREIKQTKACAAAPECAEIHMSDVAYLSLWPAPGSAKR